MVLSVPARIRQGRYMKCLQSAAPQSETVHVDVPLLFEDHDRMSDVDDYPELGLSFTL